MLAVAEGLAPDRMLPDRQNDIDFELLGLVGFEDPLRASVPAAVEQARAAGIAVAMVTGGHAATALAVAAQAGIDTRAGVLSGDDLARLADAALPRAVREVRVFARVLPVLFGLPVLMLPAHDVLTETVIDPVCLLAFEGAPEDHRVMQWPPRRGEDGTVGRPKL